MTFYGPARRKENKLNLDSSLVSDAKSFDRDGVDEKNIPKRW